MGSDKVEYKQRSRYAEILQKMSTYFLETSSSSQSY